MSDTAMSDTTIETVNHRVVEAPRLSRRGLLWVFLLLMGTPLALIAGVWFTLPPVRQKPLDADVRLANAIDTEWFASLDKQAQDDFIGRIEDDGYPMVVVKNNDDVEWAAVGVMVNKVFEFFIADPLPPGEEVELYLHRFHSRQGDMFEPLKWPVKNVKIYARIETGERAFYLTELDHQGNPIP